MGSNVKISRVLQKLKLLLQNPSLLQTFMDEAENISHFGIETITAS